MSARFAFPPSAGAVTEIAKCAAPARRSLDEGGSIFSILFRFAFGFVLTEILIIFCLGRSSKLLQEVGVI